jgi:hypothetical protein
MATEKGKTMYLSSVMSFMGNNQPGRIPHLCPLLRDSSLRKAWKDYILDKNPPLKIKRSAFLLSQMQSPMVFL